MAGLLDIKCDTTKVQARFTKMLERVDHLRRVEVGQLLSDWQTQDLHRNRPFTMRSRAKGKATTKVRPHALKQLKRSMRFGRRELRRAKRRASYIIPRQWLHTSTRPILRELMMDTLKERARQLLQTVRW